MTRGARRASEPRASGLGTQLALAVVAGLLLGASGWGAYALAVGMSEVSQRNRRFQPDTLELSRGDMVRFLNDDGDLIHHVQLNSDGFGFDSGEQPSATRTDVRFTKAGSFTVLCGIHPRMRLTVNVR